MSISLKLELPDLSKFAGIHGVGIDLVQISRFEHHLDDMRFLKRLFSEREIQDAGSGTQRASRFAARWAAKEATAKALGCGLGEKLGWREIETVKNEFGKPSILLSPEADKRHDYPILSLSMSHDGEYAIAIVILSGYKES
ncbi:MAG: holo-ACP synthase [Candidatus Electryonea clarkiae]|nr:holo-ACP synthase [Candidatus Electryonea clarkiae]MDP8288011.1 holo-ACP synthase [Candidatus Electryonea clarkiae]